MKAWVVKPKDENYCEVIFAETRGKARALALHTDCCSETDFIDIEVYRKPSVDKYYKDGKWRMDWNDPQDRLILVDKCDLRCEYVEPYMCNSCSAKDICEDYQEYLAEEEGDE